MDKVYIFDDKDKAVAFALTARYLGHKATRIGSAVLCDETVYKNVMEKTFAIPAAIVAIQGEE